jgi:hypothetical protein
LFNFVFEIGADETNGGHPIPSDDRVDFFSLARAADYRSCRSFDDLAIFESAIADVLSNPDPVFVKLKVEAGGHPKVDYELMHCKSAGRVLGGPGCRASKATRIGE